jgi:pyruvate/2-oxoglutarate dehydrogenase complex dihydrolipoamide acyltransferase (E2) component
MSPTMTEGSIANWKKKEGDSFSAGDVLLEIVSFSIGLYIPSPGRHVLYWRAAFQETDKATIDVEAQDDGVMGKIIVRSHSLVQFNRNSQQPITQIADGTKNVKVGKVIALLAEEGDDISNLEAPPEKETSSSSSSQQSQPEAAASKQESSTSTSESSPTSSASASASSSSTNGHHTTHPTHSRPLFPSVYRLLAENGIAKADKIKGTGIRGMLTKGDVLAYLGKASSPTGTFKEAAKKEEAASPAAKKPPPKVNFKFCWPLNFFLLNGSY